MGAGEHRRGGLGVGQLAQALQQGREGGEQRQIAGLAHQNAVGQVVHILGGEGEVDRLAPGAKLQALQLLAQPVLHSLHIVVHLAVPGGDGEGVGVAKLAVEGA